MTAIKPLAETKDTITLRRADFDALLQAAEDTEDLAAVEAHRSYEDRVGWDVARRNYLTGDETRRLLDGENPVRLWRRKRGISQRALAEAVQVGASYLAEIESGRKPGSVDVLQRIAAFLEVDLGTLAGDFAMSPGEGAGPVSRSQQWASQLARMAEAGATTAEMVSEVHAIVAEALRSAEKERARHVVRATLGMLRHSTEALASHVSLAQQQDRAHDIGATRRLQRISAAMEAAVDALREEYRQL
jgi:transcriptional regulator with XRE-family HTH domain